MGGTVLGPAEGREAAGRLRRERRAAGLSLAQLGKEVGRSADWVRMREAGELPMTDTEAAALAAAAARAREAAGPGACAAFAVRMRRERRARGLTQPALAARAGISVATVANTERGRTTPTLEVAGRIAEALGMRLELTGGEAARD